MYNSAKEELSILEIVKGVFHIIRVPYMQYFTQKKCLRWLRSKAAIFVS